jgi:hypothetical protein
MRIRLFLALTVALGLTSLAGAQPAKPAEPTIEVRLQSVDVLLEKAEYVAGLAGKEDVIQGVKFIVKNLQAEGKGIEGIDPKRPFGLYVTLSKDPVQSPLVAMVPIVDQDRLLGMLKDRLGITPEKAEGGALKIELPEPAKNPVINAIYLRFANEYMYVGRSAADLDPKALIAPKAYFAKDDPAIASVVVRGDRIPAEVKTFLVGQFELAVAEQRKKKGANQNPTEKAALDWLSDAASGGLKSLLEESKELSARIFIDDKADELSAEIVLTPKTGTAMARYIASLGKQMSLPAGIVSAEGAIGRGAVKIGMPAELKDGFGKVIDEAIADAVGKANGPEKEHVERALKTLAPTVKSGELDFAAALLGPDAKGRHTLLAALAVKDGKEIEKLARDFAVFAGGHADFTFDVDKVGDFTLHKVVLAQVPDEVEKLFGTKTVWVAVSNTHVAISIEPDGTALRAGLKAKPVPAAVLDAEISLAKLLPFVAKDLKPDEVKALLKDAFGDGGAAGKDTVTITIAGGDQLTAKAKVRGKGVRLLVGANLFQPK